MYPNFLALVHYFGTLLHLARRVGNNTFVVVQANLENAIMLKYLERTILDQIGPQQGLNMNLEVEWPADVLVSSFLTRIRLNSSTDVEKSLLLESIYLYKQCSQMSHLSVDAITTEVWTARPDRRPVPNFLKQRGYNIRGKIIDRFGLMLSHENLVANSTKQFIIKNYTHIDANKAELETGSQRMRLLDVMIENFEQQESNSNVTNIPEYNEYVDYLRRAPKNHIPLMGLPVDSIIFYDRELSFENFRLSSRVLGNETVRRFITHLHSQLQRDMPEKIVYGDNVLHNRRFSHISRSELNDWLAADNFNSIVDHLSEINKHPESALQLSRRLAANHVVFLFGSEDVPYPPFLIQTCFRVGKIGFLKALGDEFSPGLRSTFKANSDEIFRLAFTKYKTNENDREDYLHFLIDKKFDFSHLQKKILMRRVINNDDVNLLAKLIDHSKPAIDLHEYQQDRGITFFQSILIEGSAGLNTVVREQFIIRSPNDVVKFVPVLVGNESDKRNEAAAAADPLYWDPVDDLFNIVTKSNTKIRKGWDSLMIAAANQDHQMFYRLLGAGADTTKFMSMSKFVCESDSTCRGLAEYRNANPQMIFS